MAKKTRKKIQAISKESKWFGAPSAGATAVFSAVQKVRRARKAKHLDTLRKFKAAMAKKRDALINKAVRDLKKTLKESFTTLVNDVQEATQQVIADDDDGGKPTSGSSGRPS